MRYKVNNRKYLGSKTKVMEAIYRGVKPFIKKDYKTVVDLFGGTGASSAFFQEKGYSIIINDFLKSNARIYNAFFGSEKVSKNDIEKAAFEIAFNLDGVDNWFSKSYGGKYFSISDAGYIASIREFINQATLNVREKDILLASLIYSADRAANSMGHYDIFIERHIEDKFNFKLVDFEFYESADIFCEDAAVVIDKIEADILYMDPPYNSRQYSSLYHLLETLSE